MKDEVYIYFFKFMKILNQIVNLVNKISNQNVKTTIKFMNSKYDYIPSEKHFPLTISVFHLHSVTCRKISILTLQIVLRNF